MTPAAHSRTTYRDVAAHFDKMAEAYDEGCGRVAWVGPEKLHTGLAALIEGEQNRLRVLDIGAGTGRLGGLFKAQNPSSFVSGVDIAPDILAVALQQGRVDEAIVSDVAGLSEKLSLKRDYDIVTCAGVFDFFDRDQAALFAANTAKALKPGGLWALTYEPAGTAFDGRKTLQHDPSFLRDVFERQGLCAFHAESFEAYAYEGCPAVENIAVFGTSLE